MDDQTQPCTATTTDGQGRLRMCLLPVPHDGGLHRSGDLSWRGLPAHTWRDPTPTDPGTQPVRRWGWADRALAVVGLVLGTGALVGWWTDGWKPWAVMMAGMAVCVLALAVRHPLAARRAFRVLWP